jgi:hypothetical protein
VGDDQRRPLLERQVAVGQPEDVELDRVDTGLDGGAEALQRVAGRDQVGALVADQPQLAPLLPQRAQKSWFSPAKISETESSVKMRRIESAKVLAVESTVMLSGAPGRSGSVSVTTICSMPEFS